MVELNRNFHIIPPSPKRKFVFKDNPEGHVDHYVMKSIPISSDICKMETYPKDKVFIAGIPDTLNCILRPDMPY